MFDHYLTTEPEIVSRCRSAFQAAGVLAYRTANTARNEIGIEADLPKDVHDAVASLLHADT